MGLFGNKQQPETLDPQIQESMHVMPGVFKGAGVKMVTPQTPAAQMTAPEVPEVVAAPVVPVVPVIKPRISSAWYVALVFIVLLVAVGTYFAFFMQPTVTTNTAPPENIAVVPENPVIPEPEQPVAEPEIPVTPVVIPPQIKSASTDTDNDGLTDVEEVVYETTVANPDMDQDGYPDGLEVKNLYNPIGFAPVRIEDSGLVQKFLNVQENYQFIYPKGWQVQGLITAPRDVMLTPPAVSGEYFQISVLDNPQKLPLLTWYMQEIVKTEVDASIVKRVIGKVLGKEGILSQDNQTVYFDVDNRIFAIQYHAENVSSLNYPAVFVMLYQGFTADAIVPSGLFEVPGTSPETPISGPEQPVTP